MMRRFCLLVVFILLGKMGWGQNFSPYFILEQHSKYIDYMINSGKLRVEHPLNQPYASGMLLDSIAGLEDSVTGHWRKLLQQDLEVVTLNGRRGRTESY
jgi:hypothetical protein